MAHPTGTVGNADIWTAVFVDANTDPVDPDGDVTWLVYDERGRLIDGEGAGTRVDIGTFTFVYTPTKRGAYWVKAMATVGGIPQATKAVMREVVR